MPSYRYTSPLRPLDIGWAARAGNVEIDWAQTTVGPMVPETMATRIYAFKAPLPERIVAQLELVLVGAA